MKRKRGRAEIEYRALASLSAWLQEQQAERNRLESLAAARGDWQRAADYETEADVLERVISQVEQRKDHAEDLAWGEEGCPDERATDA